MRRSARQSSTIAAVAVSMMLAVTACTGGNDADPTSEVPLTPGGSVINESTSSPPTSAPNSGSPGSITTSAGSATTPAGRTSPGRSTVSSADGPTSNSTDPTTVVPSSDSSPTSVSTTTSPPPSTTGPTKTTGTPPESPTARPSRSSDVETVVMNAEEINTRKDIEKAWLKYWDVYVAFNRIPKSDRPAKFGAVAMDPELGDLLRTADLADQKHLVSVGNVAHRVYWGPPVSGKSSVVIGDCTDQSKFRSKNTATGQLQPAGPARVNFNGTLQKVSGGIWKVSFLDFREGVKC